MQNKFNQKDFQQIEQKFKHKNLEEKLQIQKNAEVNFSHPEIKNKLNLFTRDFSTRKKDKFQTGVSRKLSNNTEV